jgi:ribosome biogenesis GTPase
VVPHFLPLSYHKKAVENGEILARRHESYLRLIEEITDAQQKN